MITTTHTVLDDTFQRADTAAGAAGSTTGLGNGLVDLTGGVWHVANNTLAFTNGNSSTYLTEAGTVSRQSLVAKVYCPATTRHLGDNVQVFAFVDPANWVMLSAQAYYPNNGIVMSCWKSVAGVLTSIQQYGATTTNLQNRNLRFEFYLGTHASGFNTDNNYIVLPFDNDTNEQLAGFGDGNAAPVLSNFRFGMSLSQQYPLQGTTLSATLGELTIIDPLSPVPLAAGAALGQIAPSVATHANVITKTLTWPGTGVTSDLYSVYKDGVPVQQHLSGTTYSETVNADDTPHAYEVLLEGVAPARSGALTDVARSLVPPTPRPAGALARGGRVI